MCTSGLSTRPSLPVPGILAMSTSYLLRRPRTAGVARPPCLVDRPEGSDLWWIGVSWSGFDSTSCSSSGSSTSPFSFCLAAAFWGCCASSGDPACSAGGVTRASSSGEISLRTSISHKGFSSQLKINSYARLDRSISYLSDLHHVICLIMKFLNDSIKSRGDLPLLSITRDFLHTRRSSIHQRPLCRIEPRRSCRIARPVLLVLRTIV